MRARTAAFEFFMWNMIMDWRGEEITNTPSICHLLPLYPPSPQLSAHLLQRSDRAVLWVWVREVEFPDGCFRVSQASVRVRVCHCVVYIAHSLLTQRSVFLGSSAAQTVKNHVASAATGWEVWFIACKNQEIKTWLPGKNALYNQSITITLII